MGGVVEGVAAVLPAAFEPALVFGADNEKPSTSVDTGPSFSAEFPPNPDAVSSGHGAVVSANSRALKAATVVASAGGSRPNDAAMHAALIPLLPCLPPICPPSGRPDALPALLLLSVRVLGAVSSRTEAGLSSGAAGEASKASQGRGAGGLSPAMSYLSAAGAGSKEAASAVDFVRACVREVWRYGDAPRIATAGATAAVGVPPEGDVLGMGGDAGRGGVDASVNGFVSTPPEVAAAANGGEAKEDATEQVAVDEEDDDDDWGEDDFQGADTVAVAPAAIAEPIEAAMDEVCAAEEPPNADNAEDLCVGEEDVVEEGLVVPAVPQAGDGEEMAAAAEAEAASVPEGERKENAVSPLSGSEKEGDGDQNIEGRGPRVEAPPGPTISVGGDECGQDAFSSSAGVAEDNPSTSDAEDPVVVVEAGGIEAAQTDEKTLVPAAAVRAEEVPTGKADDAPASPHGDGSAVANGADSFDATTGRSSSVSETIAAPNVAAVESVETSPDDSAVAPAGTDDGSSTEPSSPLVPNALNLVLSTGRAVNELLEDLLRRGSTNRTGSTLIPGAAGTAAAVCSTAEAWGAVALTVPQEAEGIAGPLREALTAPVDRCSVATRLALLHAVSVTVRAAVAEGEDAAVVEAIEAAEARGAAAALLRLLAPHALAGLKLEVDRVAALGGGGGGDGETDEPREACLLEGVHIAQVAFKVLKTSLRSVAVFSMFWHFITRLSRRGFWKREKMYDALCSTQTGGVAVGNRPGCCFP